MNGQPPEKAFIKGLKKRARNGNKKKEVKAT